MSGRVFIGRLNPSAGKNDVEKFFKGYGRIRDIYLKRGYGFVEFYHPRDAEDAVYALDGKELCNDRVTIEHARERHGGQGWGSSGGSDRHSRGSQDGRSRNGTTTRNESRLIVENLSSRVSWQIEREDPLNPHNPIYELDASPYPLHPTTSSNILDEDRAGMLLSSPTPSFSSSNSLFSSQPKPHKRRRGDDHDDDLLLRRLENMDKHREQGAPQPDDEDVRFGQIVTDTLRKFPRQQKSMAKFKIHQVLFEIEQSVLTDDKVPEGMPSE